MTHKKSKSICQFNVQISNGVSKGRWTCKEELIRAKKNNRNPISIMNPCHWWS